MRVRKLNDDGDMRLGRGSSDFFVDTAEGVAQNVVTRLALWRGTWFIDTEEGTPWLQSVLGKRTAVETIIRDRILQTPGVRELTSFQAILDPDTRRIGVQATITTDYGSATISEDIQ